MMNLHHLTGHYLPLDFKVINRHLYRDRNVFITGQLHHSEMRNYIALGHIGLSIINPINYSYKISLPFKLIEQMACGLPIVAPKGFPEIEKVIKAANCGYLVDHQNAEQFASVVIDLATNKDKRKFLGENAIKYIKEKHNTSYFESQINNILQEVINGTIK